MAKQIISKNISFEDFDKAVIVAKSLIAKGGFKNLNFGGNVIIDEKGKQSQRFNISWEAEEEI
jgi:hypothetical protein